MKNITLILASDTTSILDNQFEYATFRGIYIPNGVTSIGSYAFYEANSLESIIIPNSVASIGFSAFRYASSLKTVTFEKNSQLTSIRSYAFYGAYNLESIIIPNNVGSIGFSIFYNANSLTIYTEISSKPSGWNSNWNSSNSQVIWGYVETIDDGTLEYALSTNGNAYVLGMLDNPQTTDVVIPNNINDYIITNIIVDAFRKNEVITSIYIPNSVISIGSYAFYYVDSLKTITFEKDSQLTSI